MPTIRDPVPQPKRKRSRPWRGAGSGPSKHGLTLHPEKTRIVDATQNGGFDFLGYHFSGA